MEIKLYKNDLPSDLKLGESVAIDTEAMGLKPHRDRLCVVQLSFGDGICHLVQIESGYSQSPNLLRVLSDPKILKIFHFARFDVATIFHHLKVMTAPIYCTKIVSKLVRTYTERHGLKDLCKELLSIELSKQEQSSDWGALELTAEQKKYAASDVFYLHRLKEKLDIMLDREGKRKIAEACFNFLPYRAELDLTAGDEFDIFHH